MKVLLDTNVILDFCLNRERYEYSKEIIIAIESYKIVGVLGAQSIPTIYFYLRQIIKHNTAMEFIKDLIIKFIVADLNMNIFEEAINLNFNDYEDGLLSQTAIKENCDYVITNNIKDFKKSKITAITSKEFVNKFLSS